MLRLTALLRRVRLGGGIFLFGNSAAKGVGGVRLHQAGTKFFIQQQSSQLCQNPYMEVVGLRRGRDQKHHPQWDAVRCGTGQWRVQRDGCQRRGPYRFALGMGNCHSAAHTGAAQGFPFLYVRLKGCHIIQIARLRHQLGQLVYRRLQRIGLIPQRYASRL